MMDMIHPISTVTARELLAPKLVNAGIPNEIDGARLVQEIHDKGGFVTLQFLMDVWMEVYTGERKGGSDNDKT